MIIPIVVSGIERVDNVDIIDDTISFSINGEKEVNLKYLFGDSSISAYTFEEPIITPSSDFIVTKSENDNIFNVKYIGSSSETSGILTISVKIGEEEYEDTINIVVSN